MCADPFRRRFERDVAVSDTTLRDNASYGIYVNAAGAMWRGYDQLVKFALFTPVYWGLMSIAAWKALIQLFTRPHYWEKTTHGLTDEPPPEELGAEHAEVVPWR